MSIVCSLITDKIGIIKSDSRGTFNNTYHFSQKSLKLSLEKQVLLIGFTGVLNFNHIPVLSRLISLRKDLFSHYSNTGNITDYLIDYFSKGLKAANDIGGNETIMLNIISKKDHEQNNAAIHAVYLDYRNGNNIEDRAIWKLSDSNKIWRQGDIGDDTARHYLQQYFSNLPSSSIPHKKAALAATNKAMKGAIATTKSCGKPITTQFFEMD